MAIAAGVAATRPVPVAAAPAVAITVAAMAIVVVSSAVAAPVAPATAAASASSIRVARLGEMCLGPEQAMLGVLFGAKGSEQGVSLGAGRKGSSLSAA